MSIISKIIAAIMSFLMLLFPGLGVEEREIDLDTVRVFNLGSVPAYKGTEPKIVSDYEAWMADGVRGEDETYDEKFFEDNSLAIVVAELPAGKYTVKATSAVENGEVLELKYVSGEFGMFEFCDEHYKAIIVPVSKAVTTISAAEI